MKIKINESQYKQLLRENVDGLDNFIGMVIQSYPEVEEYKDIIKKFIEQSGCPKIEVTKFENIPAGGLALHDKVVFNQNIFTNRKLPEFLYIVFHEIAHQFQYKKYGAELIYKIYTGELPIDESVVFLKKTENIADQFGMRKCRELQKLGYLKGDLIKVGFYQNVNDFDLKRMLVGFRNLVKKEPDKNPKKISELFYNYVVNKMIK